MGRPRLNITGEQYGKFLVQSFCEVRNGASYWNCLCDCGKSIVVRGSNLISGDTQSCGCAHVLDMTGKRYGSLVFQSFVERRKEHTYWNCLCDCGNVIVIYRYSVVSGRTKSCGCWKYSELENIVENVLLKHNISFKKQYKLLPTRQSLDFLIFYDSISIGIECQGIQHYKPVEFFGGVKEFLYTNKQDEKKRIYLRNHNIPLIEVPYWEEDIEEFLLQQLKDIE